MDEHPDTNAEMWKSEEMVKNWATEAERTELQRAAHRRIVGELLPFGEQDTFTFLDLGAGTGAASRTILEQYPRSSAILADFSPAMMDQGGAAMAAFAGRFDYVEFDLLTGDWPGPIPSVLDAVITSMCVHHLPDDRKRSLFGEIFEHLAPGGWYLNYDPVSPADPMVEATWDRVNALRDPVLAHRHAHPSPQEQARRDNHVRFIAPLEPQLGYLRSAGFGGVDVYWKDLENTIFGSRLRLS